MATTTTRALECARKRITTASTQVYRTATDRLWHTTTARLSTFTAPHQAQKPSSIPGTAVAGGPIPKPPSSNTAGTTLLETSSAAESISIAKPTVQTLDRRLRFLSGSRPSSSNRASNTSTVSFINRGEQHHESTLPPSSPDHTESHRRRPRKPASTWKNYRPGFQPGDFICPQCGTHNFSPPEHRQLALQESTTLLTKKHSRKQHQQQLSSSSSSLQQDSNTEQLTSEIAISGSGSGRRLSRFQREIIPPKRKYPQGASAHCFECGFQTAYSLPSFTTTTTTTTVWDQKVDTANRPSAADTTTSTQPIDGHNNEVSSSSVYRNDIRLSKPRDYVCPHCQTVNYNNRLHCVGCGVLAPWIQTRVEQSVSSSTAATATAIVGSGRKGRHAGGQGTRSSKGGRSVR